MNPRNSKIILAKGIAVDKDYNNVLSYSQSDMLSLLRTNTHKVIEKTGYSFIRDTGTIQVDIDYSICLGANYMAFQNADYSNKWFFAWIDDVEYRGERNTIIKYTIDSWTTWYDDWTAKKCFVNRHHVNDDTIGKNRVPENLAINDIIELGETLDSSISKYFYIAVQCAWEINDNSDTPRDGKQFDGITVYNKQVYGTPIILFGEFSGDLIDHAEGVPSADLPKYGYLLKYLKRVNADGHIADIENIFVIPSALIKPAYLTQHTAYTSTTHTDEYTIKWYTLSYTDKPESIQYQISKVTSYTDYTPKNNKCFCYPINYLYVTNNNGNHNIYKYEDFYGSSYATFSALFSLSVGVSAKLMPSGYKGQTTLDCDNSISLGKYPVCGWSCDAFTNWLTSQAVNIATSWIGSIPTGSKSEESGVTEIGAGVGIAKKVAGVIGALYEGALMPNIQGGNNNTADVLFAGNLNGLVFRQMRASLQDLKIIDDYFTRFGYAIKKLETPNITGRTYWNYVEIGETEEIGYGDVPNKFMEEINKACRKGVTIWHSHDNIGNWDLTNSIVTI